MGCEARRNPERKPELHIRASLTMAPGDLQLKQISDSDIFLFITENCLVHFFKLFFSFMYVFELQVLSEGKP